MKTKYVLGACLGILVCGCGSSTPRTLDLSTQQLVLDIPVQVQPPGAKIITFSGTGRYYVVKTETQEKQEIEVRTYSGKTVFRIHNDEKTGYLPIMFLANDRQLVCLRYAEEEKYDFVLVDSTNGKIDPVNVPALSKDESSAYAMALVWGAVANSNKDMACLGHSLLLSSGKIVAVPQEAEFMGRGADGDLHFKSSKGLLRATKVGTLEAIPPGSESGDDGQIVRGDFKLKIQYTTVDTETQKASIGSLWLSHKKEASILVGVGYEFGEFGFVPGRDAVYFLASDSCFVVPFHYEKLEGSSGDQR